MKGTKGTKDRIVMAAVDLFSEKGYKDTSMREIADAISMQPASLYNHFSSKLAILEHILDMYSKLVDKVVPNYDQLIEELDAKAALHAIFFTFPEDENNLYPKILKIIFHEQYRNERIHKYMRDIFFSDLTKGLQEVLDKMVKKGKIPPVDTERYAKLLDYITIAAALEYCHYTPEEYKAAGLLTQFDLMDLVIDTILKTENSKNATIP